jgi:ABC-type bacteriocin/lantibiotic exporter with double-glycine peptidase domain
MARVIKQFKFFRHTGLHADRSDKRITSYLDARTAHFRILLLQYKVLIAFKVLITAAMLIVGCFLLLEQQINIGQFVAAEIVIIIVINSVEKLIVNLDSVYSALTSVEKINKLLDKPVEKEGSFTVDRVPLSLQLTNISFGYDSESPILNKLSFTLPAGEKLGMQGPNGSGKSTLLRLLTGAYTGFTGSLLINEAPIGNYDLQSLRANTGIVLSQEDIFAGTLWENLTMNNQHLDRSYVLELCRRTGLQAFVTTLKEGFDTELHPGGRQLSRGIIQRILLVRAMASKPGLLLLEEPMAGIEGADSDSIRELILSLPNTTVVAATNNTDFLNGCQHRISLLPNVSGQ